MNYDMIFGNFMTNPQQSFWYWFGILILGVWLYRSCRLWITLKKTPCLLSEKPASFPLVSVLIPAKNEEKNIEACIESLKNQSYLNYEMLVINDNSTDQTEALLQNLGIPYLNAPKAPDGWTGKNHALDYGAARAKGEWLLFTDADTRHVSHALASALAHCQNNDLDFLSLLPHCLTGSFVERIVQPLAMAFLGLWFPMEKVNDPKSKIFFANGQYLMIRHSLYKKLGGHHAVKAAFLEDFALMRLAKESGAKTQCAFGREIYGTRMYDSFDSIWRGWRRIYLHAFERNAFPLFRNALMVFLFSIFPFLTLGFYGNMNLLIAGSILSIVFLAHRAVKANGFYAFFHPLAAFILFGILLDAAQMAIRKEKTVWR